MGISVKLKNDSHSDQSEQHPATSPNSNVPRSMMHASPSSVSQQLSQQPIYHNQPVISSPRSNYSFEERDGVDRNFSFSSSKSNLSDASYDHSRTRMHQFVVRSFTTPTKCMHCTSLMVRFTPYQSPFNDFYLLTDRSHPTRRRLRFVQLCQSHRVLFESSYAMPSSRESDKTTDGDRSDTRHRDGL